jgi:hypothetical protein
MQQDNELLNIYCDYDDAPFSAELEEAIRKTRENIERAARASHKAGLHARLKKVVAEQGAVTA